MTPDNRFQQTELTLIDKIWNINWGLLLFTAGIAGFGVAILYSSAHGDFHPWAKNHTIRYGVTLPVVIGIALVPLRIWFKYAYVLYGLSLALLMSVEIMGHIGMGAQRWLNLGVIRLQPSEFMKMALVLVLARYFHQQTYRDIGHILTLIIPALLVIAPIYLVLAQPDLGTGILMGAGSAVLFFMAGVRFWKFAFLICLGLVASPFVWGSLKDYQQQRILTFLNPGSDPLGDGYNIIQSMITLGSGGVWGKGFMAGTQSHLDFLPEKRTDFIVPMLAEEFGFVGSVLLLALFTCVLFYGWMIAIRARNQFGRLVAAGITTQIFLYVCVNIGMVTGLMPVVGVPLPLVSYGGSAILTVMSGIGLLICVYVHRDIPLSRHQD